MKKYLLPLIIILLLTFTLIGNCWVAGYDQRIKLTVDHTKVDATLSNFPVTAFFTAAQAEEIFAEFDADDDFDRGQFALGDDTLLYADCEKFDDSASLGTYHFKVTSISSSAGTDIYFYYDNDHAHNTTYISKSGGTAAQSVYDANFKAVYHMNDAEVIYDTKYEATVEPDSDGWTLGGTDYASVSAGILTIDTSASDNHQCYYYQTPDVNFNNGFYLKTRVKLSTDMAGGDFMEYIIHDGTQNERVIFRIEDGNLRWIYNDDQNGSAVLDTTTSYVVYEIYVMAANCKIYADSVLKANFTVDSETVSDVVEFGDTSATWMVKAQIDYVYYALNIGWNPVLNTAILDSTSNNNDGTKKGSGEPAEATGKVGQGQDFDGSDDKVSKTDNASLSITGDLTLECIAKLGRTNYTSNTGLVAKWVGSPTADRSYSLAVDWQTDNNEPKLLFYISSTGSGGYNTCKSTASLDDGNYHYCAATFDTSTKIQTWIDGASDGSDVTDIIAAISDEPSPLWIGQQYQDASTTNFDGVIDEVRISAACRADAWLKATYNSLFDSLLTYGSEETSIVINVINFGCNF